MGDLQRLSLWEGVKPQANGGRKIDGLTAVRLTNSLNLRESVSGVLSDRGIELRRCLKILAYHRYVDPGALSEQLCV